MCSEDKRPTDRVYRLISHFQGHSVISTCALHYPLLCSTVDNFFFLLRFLYFMLLTIFYLWERIKVYVVDYLIAFWNYQDSASLVTYLRCTYFQNVYFYIMNTRSTNKGKICQLLLNDHLTLWGHTEGVRSTESLAMCLVLKLGSMTYYIHDVGQVK